METESFAKLKERLYQLQRQLNDGTEANRHSVYIEYLELKAKIYKIEASLIDFPVYQCPI